MNYGTQTFIARLLEGSHEQHEFMVYFRHSKLKIKITPNGSLVSLPHEVSDCLRDDDDHCFDDVALLNSCNETSLEYIYKEIYKAIGEENRALVTEVDSFWDDFLGVVKRALYNYLDGEYQFKIDAEMKMLKRKKRKLQDFILESRDDTLYSNLKKPKVEE